MKTTIFFSLLLFNLGYSQSKKDKLNFLVSKVDSLQAIVLTMQLDSDNDKVNDYWDECKETPKGARVDGAGCPLDTDLDGIIDLYDNCVTQPGIAEKKGCPEVFLEVGCFFNYDFPRIEFSHQSDILEIYEFEEIARCVDLISNLANFQKLYIIGHANDYIEESKNRELSAKRAKAVLNYIRYKYTNLTTQFEIVAKGSSNLKYPECRDFTKCQKEGKEWANKINNGVEFSMEK